MKRSLGVAVSLLVLSAPVMAFEGRVVKKDGGQPVADAEVGDPRARGQRAHGCRRALPVDARPAPPVRGAGRPARRRYVKPILVETLPAGVADPRGRPRARGVGDGRRGQRALRRGRARQRRHRRARRGHARAASPRTSRRRWRTWPAPRPSPKGHAAVPAVRGLASGRTLILIDGARVTAERRVGPSATYVDPASLEGIEIARGPGSVAYGSDAFGGVVQLRTRRAEPGSPLGGRFTGAARRGHAAAARGPGELTRGFDRGGVLVQGHWRNFEDWDSPEGEVLNSGAEDRGFLARFDHALGGGLFSAGWQSDFGRDIERPAQQLGDRALLLPGGELASAHPRLGARRRGRARPARGDGVRRHLRGHHRPGPLRRPPPAPRSVERADVSAKDFHVRAFGENDGRPREARRRRRRQRPLRPRSPRHRDPVRPGGRGRRPPPTTSPTEDARRLDTGLYLQAEVPAGRVVVLSGGGRVDRVTTKNVGGYFGDRAENNAAFSGFASATVGSFGGFSATAPGRARVPRPHAVGPLLPRADRPRLHHRQSRPGAGDQPAVRRRAALRGRRAGAWPSYALPLSLRRPRRAVPDRDRLLLLPEPRPGAYPRERRPSCRRRCPGGSAWS